MSPPFLRQWHRLSVCHRIVAETQREVERITVQRGPLLGPLVTRGSDAQRSSPPRISVPESERPRTPPDP